MNSNLENDVTLETLRDGGSDDGGVIKTPNRQWSQKGPLGHMDSEFKHLLVVFSSNLQASQRLRRQRLSALVRLRRKNKLFRIKSIPCPFLPPSFLINHNFF